MAKHEQIWLIYKATGKCGRGYVGITTMPMARRKAAHRGAAKAGEKSLFWDAMREHGQDYFTWEVLTECYSSKEAIMCEQAMIAVHDTFYTRNGWNRNIGGGGNVYGHMDSETKKKISGKIIERNKKNPEYRWLGAKAYNAMGRPVSEEGRTRKREGLKTGHTAEVWAKGAATRTGKKQSEKQAASSRANFDKGRAIFKHQCWAQNEYQKALAARIGYARPHKPSTATRAYHKKLSEAQNGH